MENGVIGETGQSDLTRLDIPVLPEIPVKPFYTPRTIY
jgi:hypothetical protein